MSREGQSAVTRRLISLCAAAAIILTMALATGCDRGSAGAKAITVVIAEYSKDHTKPFWQALAEQYTKQTGIKVDLRIIDWNSIDQQVSTMIQNNQPPDVLNLNSFSSYAKDGLLYSADEVLSPKTRDDFLAPFARGGEYQGKLYGFPILSSARAFFYNKDLFAKASLAGPPKTWEDFVQTARTIQGLGGGMIGYALPLGPEEAQAEWSIWMWNGGGDWKAGDAWAINSDANVRTLSFLADLANRDRVTQVNPGKTNRTDGAFQLFKDGKVGHGDGLQPAGCPARRRGQGGLWGGRDADEHRQARDPGRRGLSDGLQEEGQPGGGQAVPRSLLPAGEHHPVDHRGGLPAGDDVRPGQMDDNPRLKPYLDALPNARLVPTTDPAWDRVKLDAQQNIGVAVQPGGDPRQVLDQLQKNAVAAASGR